MGTIVSNNRHVVSLPTNKSHETEYLGVSKVCLRCLRCLDFFYRHVVGLPTRDAHQNNVFCVSVRSSLRVPLTGKFVCLRSARMAML